MYRRNFKILSTILLIGFIFLFNVRIGKKQVKANTENVVINKYFDDPILAKYISDNYDKDGDGKLSVDERWAVNQLNLDGMGIQSLNGIEVFDGFNLY